MRAKLFFITLLIGIPPLMLSGAGETADLRIINKRIEGDDFKFDMQLKRTSDWAAGYSDVGGLGDSDFYFTYTSGAFTGDPGLENIKTEIGDNPDDYSILVQITGGRIQVKVTFNEETAEEHWQPALDTWETLCTVTWEIADPQKSSGVEWDQVNTGVNDCDEDAVTILNWEGSGDMSLPVQMTAILAEPEDRGISLAWSTATESRAAGFHVWRSTTEKDDYLRVSHAMIQAVGNHSQGGEYGFLDRHVREGVMYYYRIECVSTDGTSDFYGPVSALGVQAVPREFGLSQNYPNPFNPETAFRYQLPEPGEVLITVYSLLGKQVRVLVKGHRPAGYYEERWDGNDDLGRPAGSGIYLLRVQAGRHSMIRKMTLIR